MSGVCTTGSHCVPEVLFCPAAPPQEAFYPFSGCFLRGESSIPITAARMIRPPTARLTVRGSIPSRTENRLPKSPSAESRTPACEGLVYFYAVVCKK